MKKKNRIQVAFDKSKHHLNDNSSFKWRWYAIKINNQEKHEVDSARERDFKTYYKI